MIVLKNGATKTSITPSLKILKNAPPASVHFASAYQLSHRTGSGDTFYRSPSRSASGNETLPQALTQISQRHTDQSDLLLLFGATRRPRDQREREGPMVRPAAWSFPETFVKLMDHLAENANMANGAQYLVRVQAAALYQAFLDRTAPKPIVQAPAVEISATHHGKPVVTTVKPLIGPEQILKAWVHVIENAKDSIQIALYDFDNTQIPGGRSPNGADFTDYWYWQQLVLLKLIDKAQEFKQEGKGKKVQILLDSSKQREYTAFGLPKDSVSGRRYKINNEAMVTYLRDLASKQGLPIEVETYPRWLAKLYHIKGLFVGNQSIMGGMNLSNHSAANWDACVLLDGAETANVRQQTFEQDWIVARTINELGKGHTLKQTKQLLTTLKPEDYARFRRELPEGPEAVSDPTIRVMNTMPDEYKHFGFKPREEIGDYFKETFSDPQLQEVMAEQFVFTHKALTEKLIERYQSGTLNARMLHAAGVLRSFPYTRKAVHRLYDVGGSDVLRYYRENRTIGEQLHAKLFILKRVLDNGKIQYETVIGSSNSGKVAMETNVTPGRRSDYPNTDETSQRGNRDVMLAIPSNALAKPFVDQFEIDWNYSQSDAPSLHGSAELAARDLRGINPQDLSEEQLQALDAEFGLEGRRHSA